MRTYVIQLITLNVAQAEICQADNITQVLEFLTKKYGKTMGKIEFIYSEEYNEKNISNTR